MSPHVATLEIDLGAIADNWQLLKAQLRSGDCGGVVKANAYGLGVEQVAPALAAAGCKQFFVATLEEGVQLRTILPQHEIAVFHGIAHGEEADFLQHRLSPVLNDLSQLQRWQAIAPRAKTGAILHVDTGMTRLGFNEDDAQKAMGTLGIGMVMSHLACGGTPEHPLNQKQLSRFRRVRALFPDAKASLANSSGVFLGTPYHFDLVRPGCSLYGISPNLSQPNPMKQVARLTAPILQLRTLERDETVGYEASHHATHGTKLATVGLGYADGLLRALSNKLTCFIDGQPVKLVGRVSMDMVILDVTALKTLTPQSRVEFIGPHQTVDEVATLAGTIAYEIFTRLGARIHRNYLK